MPATCNMCLSNITSGRFPGVKCGGTCEKLFHVKCAQISEDLLKGIKDRSVNWLCEACRDDSSHSIVEDDSTDAHCNVSLVDIMTQLKKMERKLSSFEELKQNVNNLQSQNCSLLLRVQKLEEQLEMNNTKLHLIEADNDKQNQLNNITSIAISGLPMKHDDIRGMIINTIGKLQLTIQTDDIVSIAQVHNNFMPSQSNKLKTKKILNDFFIVKFKTIEQKQNILTQMKIKKTLHTNELDVFLPQNHPEQRIYIMQHFTKFQSQLYREAKNIKIKYGYKFLWVKSGQIYLRKSADSDAHRIHSMNDIFRIQSGQSIADKPGD